MQRHWFLIITLVLLGCTLFGTAPLHAQQSGDERCFGETSFCISGRIRTFWEQNGGLAVFGLPTSPQQAERVEAGTFQVQWFERNRLELHPENAAPYDVLLGRLGADQQQRIRVPSLREQPLAGCVRFEQTQHNVCADFAEAWRRDGLEFDGQPGKSFEESLALWGLPLTNRMTMTLSDGKQHQVQYFERARFESHPENAAPYNVLFGLLANEWRANTAPARPATLLPAPLFFLYDSQIFRLERDGLTQTPIVDERGNGEITIFTLAPTGSVLAYVLKTSNGWTLVRRGVTDGNRAELFTSPDVLSTPIWSPDGGSIALHRGDLSYETQGVLFSVPSSGGAPRTLLPDDNQNGPHIAYLPASWSPDGTHLLIEVLPKASEGCVIQLLRLSDLQVREPPTPAGQQLTCSGAWSPDGALYLSVRPSAFSSGGLWRADITTNQLTQLVEMQTDLGYNLFSRMQPLANGTISAFMSQTTILPQLGETRPILYAPYTIQPNGLKQRRLLNIAFEAYEMLGWSPDGSGFLLRGPFGNPVWTSTFWVPLDGSAPYEINSVGLFVEWGK